MLDFRMSGIEGLEDDFEKIMAEARKSISAVMPYLGTVFENDLAKHIQSDVYDAYSPKDYKRRSDNPSLGIALNELGNSMILSVFTDDTSVEIDYEPSGGHVDLPMRAVKNRDDLIRRIETGEGYDWKSPGARQFFQNFVNEVLGGKAAEELLRSANSISPDIQFEADENDVMQPEMGDWMG